MIAIGPVDPVLEHLSRLMATAADALTKNRRFGDLASVWSQAWPTPMTYDPLTKIGKQQPTAMTPNGYVKIITIHRLHT